MNAKTRRRFHRLMVLVGVLGLAACGTPTPYQPSVNGFGYGEQALEENRYRVTFSGNSLTPRAAVENYLLYRAAEVTLARGYDYFVVVGKETERTTTYFSTLHGVGGGASHHGDRHGFGAIGSSTSYPRSDYAAFANIVMRKGKKSPEDTAAYDARDVLKRLEPTINRNPAP